MLLAKQETSDVMRTNILYHYISKKASMWSGVNFTKPVAVPAFLVLLLEESVVDKVLYIGCGAL